jgi:hypothetical protein
MNRLALLCLACLPGVSARAAPPPPDFKKDALPLITKYCVSCHGGEKPKGSFRLDNIKDLDAALKRPKSWDKIADALRAGEMPPPEKKQPTTAEVDKLNTWIDVVVFKVDCNGPRDPGRVTIHRLNKVEYNNTIRDLLGIDFKPADNFPTDDAGYGFDNIGDVLSLPPLLLEKYLAAAAQIAERTFKDEAARNRFMNPPVQPKNDKEPKSRTALRYFAERAWRRPLTDQELRRVGSFVQLATQNGETAEKGTQLAMQAVLVSPFFLFRIEQDRQPTRPDGAHPISDYELASRLSYFLWATMPDDALFKLAADSTLRKPDVLEAEVKRMLKDPKAKALSQNFATQWLQIRGLASFAPDPKMFPTFDEPLRNAMMRETERFFQYIVDADRSVLELIDSDYTFVNERLAKHYGIEGVKGGEFRKVKLPDNRRGGILAQASVLTVTSNPTRTSAVKRGKWIMENILGTPPPPPPPDVPELKEEKQAVLSGTLRQRMEQHRANPSCANCHQKMDPLGFGFENFDVIGAWRVKEGKFAIDASGMLPGGKKFNGPAELRGILKQRQGEFCRCLSEKLLTYALGRGMERPDRCTIDDLSRNLAKSQYRFSSLVLDIVKSDAFQMRKPTKGATK